MDPLKIFNEAFSFWVSTSAFFSEAGDEESFGRMDSSNGERPNLRNERYPEQSKNQGQEPNIVTRRILIVDDDKLVLMTLKRLLSKEGYKISIALGGQAALNLICDNNYDLIISDLKMPGMNGVETVAAIREYLAKNNKKAIPEIFISAYVNEDIYQEALKLNAVEYLEKPFDIKALLQAVKKAINNSL
ncbi:MAG: response regulator [Candidatus Omnitrophota bacterium]|nr:response regulator [Candidatus Omnitrophota bacterium]